MSIRNDSGKLSANVVDRQDLLFDVLRIAYGSKKIAGLIMTVGAGFLVAGRAVASDNKIRERLKSRDWTSDPAVCDIAIEAAHTVLESFRPAGVVPWKSAGAGVLAANTFVKSIRHDSDNPAAQQMREVPREILGSRLHKIASRLEQPVEDQEQLETGVIHQAQRESAAILPVRQRA